MNAVSTMTSVTLPLADAPSETAWSGADGVDALSARRGVACTARRRCAIEGAAAVLAGSMMAVGWAAMGATDDRANERHTQLETEMARMASPLAELARLERAAESAKAAAAQAQMRSRPSAEMRSLLDALSREANAGVTVSRLQRTDDGIELRIRAADSAACASWVQRLARTSGLESARTIELKSIPAAVGRGGEHTIEAAVRLHSPGATGSSQAVPPLRRPARGDRARSARGEP